MRRLALHLIPAIVVVAAACSDAATTTPSAADTTTTTVPASTLPPATAPASTAPPVSIATTVPDDAATTTTAPAPTTDAGGTSTTTTSVAAAPTTAPAACSGGVDPGLPASAQSVTRARADFDGDGEDDRFAVYFDGTEWRAHLGFATGYAVDIPAGNDIGAKAIGGFDLNGGGAEAFAVVGSGAATTIVGIFTVVGCDLETVKAPGGFPAQFPVGATVANQSGLECHAGTGLDVLTQTSADGISFDRVVQRLGLTGDQLEPGDTSTGTLIAPDDQDAILAAGQFRCGDLTL